MRAQEKQKIASRTKKAVGQIALDEAETRAIIDQKFRNRGWDADTENLRYANGSRSAKGRDMAIAEWPTDSGPADYALFVGTQCIGVVEAKCQRKNVSAAIDQAERYAKDIRLDQGSENAGGPWGHTAYLSSSQPMATPIKSSSRQKAAFGFAMFALTRTVAVPLQTGLHPRAKGRA